MNKVLKVLFFISFGINFLYAQSSKIKIGTTFIDLKAPKEYAQISRYEKSIFELFKLHTPQTNELLELLLPKSKLKNLSKQNIQNINKYVLIQTIKSEKTKSISQKKFKKIISFMKEQNFTIDSRKGLINKHLKSINKEIANEIKIGQSLPLGIYLDKNEALGFGNLIRTMKNNKTVLTVAVSNFIKIKDKILLVYVYKKYLNADDIKDVEESSLKIINNLLEKNRA